MASRVITFQTASAGALDIDHPLLLEAFGQLKKMNDAVPLSSFEFRRTQTVPLVYKYEIAAADGRAWEQTITFDVPSDPRQTFEVNGGGWRLSEYHWQRRVRDILVELAPAHELTLFSVEWA